MTIRLYADELRCAIYEEAPGGGDPINPGSLMNRPIVNPLGWLANLYFHSDLDYYGVVASTLSTPITHPTIAGIIRNAAGAAGDNDGTRVRLFGQSGSSDHLLLQHDLGYVPDFYAIQGGRLVPNGVPVQQLDSRRMRWASVYATTTQIRVKSFGFSYDTDLPAVTVNYGAIVFRDHAPVAGQDMLRLEPGVAVFGQGLFDASQPHLRAAGADGSMFAIATGRTVYAKNGGMRLWLPNGGSFTWGQYDGSGAAPSFINVEVGK